jgi:putative hydrolase of the HAD superfamily
MPVRAVIFDIGGVLSQYTDFETYLKWEQRLGLPQKGLFKIIYENPISQQATLGKATIAQIWEEVGRQLDLPTAEVSKMQAEIWSGYEWNTPMLDFVRSLKPDYKTGALSDAWADASEGMVDVINHDLFDVIVFSADVGMQKPSPEIYRLTLARLQVEPQEALFLDDREKNVDGARSVGMHGLLFTETQQAIQDINHLLSDHAEPAGGP